MWREILRAVEVARKRPDASLFCLVWVLQWAQVGRALREAMEPALWNQASRGLKLEGSGSGRVMVIWLFRAVAAVFIRWFRYRNTE